MAATPIDQRSSGNGSPDRAANFRPDAALVLLLGLILAAAYLPELAGRAAFFFFDISSLNLPARDWGFRQIAAGHFPEWCPHWYWGFPFVAESQSGILYPPNYFFFLLLPGWLATAWAYVAHLWLAAAGAYFLFRMSSSRAGAFLAALSFGLGGRLLEHQVHAAVVEAIAWFPWQLFLGRRFLERGGLRPLTALGLVGALQALAGSLQTAAIAQCGLGLLFLAGAAVGLGLWRRAALGFAAQAILIAGASAPLWLPMLELLPLSVRDSALAAADANYGAIAPHRWASSFCPILFGHPAYATTWLYSVEPAFEVGLYHGGLIVLLAGVALAACRRAPRETFLYALFLVVGLTLAAGELHLAGVALRKLPIFASIRVPARFLLFAGVGLGGLAALGWDRLASARAGRLLFPVLAAALAAVVASAAWIYHPLALQADDPQDTRDRRTVLQSEFPVRFAQMARIELPWIGGTLCAGVVAALLARRRPRLAATFAAASLAIDLGHHARGWYPRIEPDFHAERGLARHIKRHGDPPRVFSNVIANNIRGFGISEIGYRYGLDRFRRLTEYLYYERGLLFDVSSIDEIGHLPLETRRMHDFRRRLVEPSKLLRIGGFAFELAPEPPSRPADYVGAHAFLTTVPDSIPFAAVIPSAISVEPDAALDELTRPEYDPAKSVVIENPSVTDPKPGRFAPAKTEWLGPNAFRVTLPEDSQGWLNVTELWYPGWTAHSAGRELPIERANHLFQAVRVAPGTKVVEFRFTSDRFRLGLFIAGPTLLAAFALLGFAPRGGPPAGDQGPGVSSLWTIVLLGAFVGSFALSALVRRNEWAKAFPTVLIAARTAQPGGGSPR